MPTYSFRPLSWGLSFNGKHWKKHCHFQNGFRPLSWGLSFNFMVRTWVHKVIQKVFVPFLGDFLSICFRWWQTQDGWDVFVPFLGDFLSMFPSTETGSVRKIVFVPFLGDFLSIKISGSFMGQWFQLFSSPFLGTFFQLNDFLWGKFFE